MCGNEALKKFADMPLSLDSALGSLPDALQLRARRADILAANLANADTPNYKARDIDFANALQRASGTEIAMTRTSANHLDSSGGSGRVNLESSMRFRVPSQPSLDGNTVDNDLEKGAFSENAVQYQATLHILSSRIRGLLTAIRGE